MNLKMLEEKIAALEKENQALRERIAELERRLGKIVKQAQSHHLRMD